MKIISLQRQFDFSEILTKLFLYRRIIEINAILFKVSLIIIRKNANLSAVFFFSINPSYFRNCAIFSECLKFFIIYI